MGRICRVPSRDDGSFEVSEFGSASLDCGRSRDLQTLVWTRFIFEDLPVLKMCDGNLVTKCDVYRDLWGFFYLKILFQILFMMIKRSVLYHQIKYSL